MWFLPFSAERTQAAAVARLPLPPHSPGARQPSDHLSVHRESVFNFLILKSGPFKGTAGLIPQGQAEQGRGGRRVRACRDFWQAACSMLLPQDGGGFCPLPGRACEVPLPLRADRLQDGSPRPSATLLLCLARNPTQAQRPSELCITLVLPSCFPLQVLGCLSCLLGSLTLRHLECMADVRRPVSSRVRLPGLPGATQSSTQHEGQLPPCSVCVHGLPHPPRLYSP